MDQNQNRRTSHPPALIGYRDYFAMGYGDDGLLFNKR